MEWVVWIRISLNKEIREYDFVKGDETYIFEWGTKYRSARDSSCDVAIKTAKHLRMEKLLRVNI
jgi:hypothetical protein